MKFEAIVKKEKMSEYLDERSPFNKLLERTCKQLRKNYRNYYSRNRPLPNYYKEWDVCQPRFGISNVSKKAFPKLMRIFGEYIDHIVTLKNTSIAGNYANGMECMCGCGVQTAMLTCSFRSLNTCRSSDA
jgi:hypothetical protein